MRAGRRPDMRAEGGKGRGSEIADRTDGHSVTRGPNVVLGTTLYTRAGQSTIESPGQNSSRQSRTFSEWAIEFPANKSKDRMAF